MQGAPDKHRHADAHRVEVHFSATGDGKSLISDSAKDRTGILLRGLKLAGKIKCSLLRKAVRFTCNAGN